MPKFERFPCTSGSCDYVAYSQVALEEHISQVHGGSAPVVVPVTSSPTVQPSAGPVASAPVQPSVGSVAEVSRETGVLAPEPPSHHPALFVPSADVAFWVEDRTLRLLVAIEKRAVRGESINVFLTGPTGTGKSSLPEQYAALNDRLCFVQHCELITEPSDWWGQREMSIERGTYFEEAAFVDAIETPGCVVVMDELNRTHPDNLSPLFGLLDHRRRAWVPFMGREVKVASGVTFWFTLNLGNDYQVNPVDLALMNRAQITIPLRYPPMDWEITILKDRAEVDDDTARKLAEFARTVRSNPRLHISISPRQLIEAAKMVMLGVPIHDSVMATTINGAVEDMDKTALLQALQTVGPVDAAYVDGNDDAS